jgi:hypothetical protein
VAVLQFFAETGKCVIGRGGRNKNNFQNENFEA